MFPVDSIKVRLLFFFVSFSRRARLPGWNAHPHSSLGNRSVTQTRMQVFATSPAAVYTGLGNAFTRISSTEGVRVLWRGVSSVIMGAGPAHAVHFGTYEAVKELTGGNREGSANQWLSARKFSASLWLSFWRD